jgi:hypothetical protein
MRTGDIEMATISRDGVARLLVERYAGSATHAKKLMSAEAASDHRNRKR